LMIDLAKERDIRLQDVEQINVKTYQVAIDITDNADPDTQYAAKFSLQFCTALAILTGDGGLDAFSEESLWDENIRKLMKRVNVNIDPEINSQYPDKWGAIVEVKLTSGEWITKETDFPKGDPENAVSPEDLLKKFNTLTKSLSTEAQN